MLAWSLRGLGLIKEQFHEVKVVSDVNQLE